MHGLAVTIEVVFGCEAVPAPRTTRNIAKVLRLMPGKVLLQLSWSFEGRITFGTSMR